MSIGFKLFCNFKSKFLPIEKTELCLSIVCKNVDVLM